MGQRDGKTDEDADRSGGGPGSSHQGGAHGHTHREGGRTQPGAPTSGRQSQVSGGGGERDSHHTHDPEQKGHSKGR